MIKINNLTEIGKRNFTGALDGAMHRGGIKRNMLRLLVSGRDSVNSIATMKSRLLPLVSFMALLSLPLTLCGQNSEAGDAC